MLKKLLRLKLYLKVSSLLICFSIFFTFSLSSIAKAATPSLSGGYDHNAALFANGDVWAWGYNDHGKLGDGTNETSYTPIPTYGISDIVNIASGYSHSLALKTDGTVWAWGSNSSGQLGDGTRTSQSIPVQVSSLSNVSHIAAGDHYSLALKADGTVWAWGDNMSGQLGGGTTLLQSTPVQVSDLSNVSYIAAGSEHCLALKADGTVWAWGSNIAGQIGDGTLALQSTPVQVSDLSNVSYITAGSLHSLALKTDGTVWAWGDNNHGQLGDSTISHSKIPVQVSSLSDVAYITAGYHHCLAIKTDGTVWAWGDNYYGQLGDGTTTDQYTPVQVSSLSDVAYIAAGYSYSLALKTDGTVWAWGYNSYGKLGDGTTTDKHTPVQVVAGYDGSEGYLNLLNNPPSTYSLTTSVSPESGGTISRSPDRKSLFTLSTPVTIYAAPSSEEYSFKEWLGDCTDSDSSGSVSTCNVVMDSDKSVIAVFGATGSGHVLTLIQPTGGTITKSPSKDIYDDGETVTLTASNSAASCYMFDSWTDDCSFTGSSTTCFLEMDSDKIVSADYNIKTFAVNTSATNGTINKTPSQSTYDCNSTVTLSAVPDSGYNFVNWAGDATGSSTSITIVVDEEKNISAVFERVSLYVSDISANPSSGTVPLSVNFSVTVTAGTSPYTYSWDFNNDGTEDSSLENPSYIYTVAGTYIANLIVTDADGDSVTRTQSIQVLPEDNCSAHAVYDSDTMILTIPYLDIALIDPITQQDSGEFAVFECKLKLVEDSVGNFSVEELTYLEGQEADSTCHASYSYEGTMYIPNVDVTTVVVLPPDIIVQADTITYALTLKQLPISTSLFNLETAVLKE